MTIQNDNHAVRRHWKVIRQLAVPAATGPKVPVLPNPTLVRPTVTRPARPPVVKPTVTAATLPAKPPKNPPLSTTAPPVVLPVPSTTAPAVSVLSTPVTSVAPLVPPTAVTSSLPQVPTTSRIVTHATSSAPRALSTASASATSTTSPQPSSGVSTGAVVGGIIGGFAALGLIGAALFLFLRRAREKKERNATTFDAAEFRQSAVILDDPVEKHKGPRPPTMIEQHVQNTPSPQPSQPTLSMGSRQREQGGQAAPYHDQGPHSTPYPGPYNPQVSYGQYPLPLNPYTYGQPHAYPPQPHYPLQPHYNPQYYGAYPHPTPPSLQIPDGSTSDRDDMTLPNPFASSPSQVSDAAGPTQHLFMATPDHTQTAGSGAIPSSAGDDAPPAYETTGKFEGYKPDMKVKPVLLTASATSDSGSAVATSPSASSASIALTAPATRTMTGTLSAPVSGDKNRPPRPLSGTSAITTIYDMRDAYGGI